MTETITTRTEYIERLRNALGGDLGNGAADMLEADGKYDQQAMELCEVCGWKAKMDGEPCLVCELPKTDKLREAARLALDAPNESINVPCYGGHALNPEQLKALSICATSMKVSVSEVQRKLNISYTHAQEVCQGLVNTGLFDDIPIAPSLVRNGKYPELTDAEITSIAYDCNALPEVITDETLILFARAIATKVRGMK